MLKEKIGIVSWGACSPLGTGQKEVWQNYLSPASLLQFSTEKNALVGALVVAENKELKALRTEQKYYKDLDRTVLMSILAARQAIKNTTWQGDSSIGVNIGSSRGATAIFEASHQHYIQHGNLREKALTSPLTTLGNLSSWTARDLSLSGLAFSHSLTCSTAFQSLLNGVAWLQAGLLNRMLVGGSEAPLTPFTIAQMQALRIYSKAHTEHYPCQAMNLEKEKNTMVLGEGAAVFALAKKTDKALAWISGIGFGTEKISHPTSISKEGTALRQSMQMALEGQDLASVDVIITHSPGTKRGDQAEYAAIQSVFGKHIPAITTNKWKIGHTLGASGALSLEMGLLMILHQQFIPIPYLAPEKQSRPPTQIKTILINTVGFGGTAASLLIGG